MKKIGMLGGMSWESTATYYKLLNEGIKEKLGGLHSAKIILSSVDFEEIEKFQHSSLWDETAVILSNEAKAIQDAKADFLIICTNTMHKVVPQIEKNIDIPILHIADATGEVLVEKEIKKVALLGTKFTMTEDFYKNRIEEKFDIEVVIPNEKEQDIIHKVIYKELCLGICNKDSRDEYIKIIKRLEEEEECEGVILGCTEISMLIKQGYVDIPIFDTTEIHANAAVLKALS
ncbi:aspartate/glutamate racemase family protein [Halarcobacter anaerophilus]|jgi:aspartate racemase|uniref:Aspartate/glutamate racemase family protein n=1 Tax=Halarcobacter anaerophilus TaxID=877500 RepID=A0A4V1LPZ0_9BACT|nr:aspartate/glutamate racemase family protein [Halarcobacter anaerophilus]QDF29905.1 aspartate/glutamate racemase family protein [Halarcobacter anaerophilus]RXJ62868.1 aspartate/glutamate racemase family protein [Halarcobacter anaerophilus]